MQNYAEQKHIFVNNSPSLNLELYTYIRLSSISTTYMHIYTYAVGIDSLSKSA